jgi:hypothetical protein
MATNAHSTQIEALVQSLEPVDWVQPMLTANLPPGQRILAGLRGTLRIASPSSPRLNSI